MSDAVSNESIRGSGRSKIAAAAAPFAISNVLSSSADFALNSYISPKYSSKTQDRARAPGQPAPAFFSIWTPIFAGRIAYGFLDESERSKEAAFWNHVVSATGFTYAWALVNDRFYSMQAAMAAMTFASFKYRAALPKSSSRRAQAVKFAAEMGLGWLAAADMLIAAKNTRRLIDRRFTEREQHAVGFAEVALAAGVGVAANRFAGWKGVSAATAWALGGIALDRKSEKHVRVVAGVAAAGVLTDLGLTIWRDLSASKSSLRQQVSAGDEATSDSEMASVELVEIDIIPTADGYLVEEIVTALRH